MFRCWCAFLQFSLTKSFKRIHFFIKLRFLFSWNSSQYIWRFYLRFSRIIVPLQLYKIDGQWKEGMNVLGLVMFSVILGATIGKMREKGKPIQDFLVAMSEAMMIITRWVIWWVLTSAMFEFLIFLIPFDTTQRLSPIGVFFLITAKILEMDSLAEVIGQLGLYFMTVLVGLFVHGFGTIAVIFFLVVRKLPYKYVFQMSQVLATAFGTGSSSATMPITINCLDNMGIDPRVTRFVIPVGATINMDGESNALWIFPLYPSKGFFVSRTGTALYEAVAALFIAQLRNISLTFGNIVAVRYAIFILVRVNLLRNLVL